MLNAVHAKETNEILIMGDLYELDIITHLIDRVTGNHLLPGSKLLPGFETSLSLLLGLTSLIRQAQDSFSQQWPEPKELDKDRIAPAPKPDPISESLNRPPKTCSCTQDEPNEIFFNPRLQVRMSCAECVVYAFLLRVLTEEKELLLKNMLAAAQDYPADIRRLEVDYCLFRARSELTLTDQLMEELFSCLAAAQEADTFAELRNIEVPEGFLKNWTGEKLVRLAGLLRKHSGMTPADVSDLLRDLFNL